MSRRVDVHLWPAVPTAPNSTDGTTRSRSASSATTTALLPAHSRSDLPKRPATVVAISRPTAEDPVNETSATRESATSACVSALPQIARRKIGGSDTSVTTRLARCCTASAVSGVLGEGFHTVALPHTAESIAFHAHTATGKLKAEITPTTPSGCH